MKISIIHPTRGRKEIAMKTMSKWLSLADKPFDIEYIFSVDSNDTDTWYNRVDLCPKAFDNSIMSCTVLKRDNKSAIDAINNAAKIATGDLFIVVSDDFECFELWDTLLIAAIHWDKEALFMQIDRKTDFLVKTVDGLQPTLITLPIMDRVYYERFGYIYHPDYVHMFSDQEMTAVGHMLGRVINVDLEFKHNHYTTGNFKKDAISLRNDSSWQQGERLFNQRLETNFGIDNPVIPYSSIIWR